MGNSSTRSPAVETVPGGGPEAGARARVRAAGGVAQEPIRVVRRVPLDRGAELSETTLPIIDGGLNPFYF
jgi:hypothetical protein